MSGVSESLDKVWQTLSSEFSLSWSYYVVLMTIKSVEARKFYEIESHENMWGVRELRRQFNSVLYERLALSRDKERIKELSKKGQLVSHPGDVLKSPYILEFLDLKEELRKQLEEAQREWALSHGNIS